MKTAPWGSCNKLLIKGIAMRKNIYKHFFTFDNGFKNGDGNKLYTGDIRKTVPELYYLVTNIVITIAAKSLLIINIMNLTFNKHFLW
jgi:hypothetical protein